MHTKVIDFKRFTLILYLAKIVKISTGLHLICHSKLMYSKVRYHNPT